MFCILSSCFIKKQNLHIKNIIIISHFLTCSFQYKNYAMESATSSFLGPKEIQSVSDKNCLAKVLVFFLVYLPVRVGSVFKDTVFFLVG